MLIELLIGTFGAYIATTGLRTSASEIKGQALANYNKIEQARSTIVQMNQELNGRIDILESQHATIYRMTEWVSVLQTMQMKGGKYIGNDIYRVIDRKDTIMLDLSRRIISERYKGLVYHRDFNTNSEYINGVLVHEFKHGMELVYNLEGKRVYVKEPYQNAWAETWYYPNGQVQRQKVGDIYKCFDEDGNITCWMSGGEDLFALEQQKQEREMKHREEIAHKLEKWRTCARNNSIGKCTTKCEDEQGIFSKLFHSSMRCISKCVETQTSRCGHMPN